MNCARTTHIRLKLIAPLLFFPLSVALYAQQAALSPVTIVVTDPTGAGVSHAQARIVPAPDSPRKMETDDKGQLSLELKAGGYAVFIRSAGFKASATHLEVREEKALQTFPVVLEIAAPGSPTVSPASDRDGLLVIAYPYHERTVFKFPDLKTMPRTSARVHNSHTNEDETYAGIPLADVLAKVGAPLGAELHGESLTSYIVATGSDGYEAVLSLAEVDPSFHPGEVIVADTMDGKPLDAHSGPLKLVVTEDKRPARSVRNLVTIELKSIR